MTPENSGADTDRRDVQALEKRLAAIEARFRLFSEATRDVVFVHDGRVVQDVAGPFEQMLGFTRDEAIGQSILGPWVDETGRAQVAARIAEGFQGHYQTNARHKDGTPVPVELTARELVVDARTVRVVFIHDLRERLANEERLAERDARFRALLDVAFDGMVVHRDGYVLEANVGFARMCGYELEEVIGMMPSAVVTPESVAIIADNIRHDRTAPYLVEGVRKDGSHFPMQIQGRRLPGDSGVRVTGFRDLTRQQEAEAERALLQQQLLQARKLEGLGVMAGGIAHDFNNLLTVILGNTELALSAPPGSPSALAALENARAAAIRAAELTRQMLAYAGRMPSARERVDLTEIVRETSLLLQIALPKGARLGQELAPIPLYVEADHGQLGQVALNLITNAGEALREDGGRIFLRTARVADPERYRRDLVAGLELPSGPCALLEVEDTGTGMDDGVLSRIFDPFFTTRFQGRGLGLATVLGIVRAHGGAIAVRSAPGQGSCFSVLLPLCSALSVAPAEGDCDVRPARGEVLIVDDEPDVGEVTAALLATLGYRPTLLASGEALIERLERDDEPPRFVVLDRVMPGLGGDQAFRRLRARWPALPVVVVSGREAPGGDFADDPRATFLPKPFTRAELVEALEVLGLGCR